MCRDWHKPGPHSIATFRLVTRFNEEVQFDLLFYHSLLAPDPTASIPIAHLVDVCVRWGSTGLPGSKEEEALVQTISQIWINIFGPMETLVLDEETGMRGRCATDWAEANSIGLNRPIKRRGW